MSLCIWVMLLACAAAAAAAAQEACTDYASPSKYDAIVGNSSLYGHANMSDAVAHDDTWAFRRYGPVSRLTLYKAWYYDGAWHDPGEFKGIQAWHGRYFHTEDSLLFGAKRPHHPLNCTLYRHEVFVAAELQWDHIMRYMNFTTNLGRWCSWGFPNVTNTTSAVVQAPGPNTYIAALRGYEGKPLPSSQGGFKKRYIVQLGFVWAQRRCNSTNATTAGNATAAAPALLPPPPGPPPAAPPLAPLAVPVPIPVVPLNAVELPPAAAATATAATSQPPQPQPQQLPSALSPPGSLGSTQNTAAPINMTTVEDVVVNSSQPLAPALAQDGVTAAGETPVVGGNTTTLPQESVPAAGADAAGGDVMPQPPAAATTADQVAVSAPALNASQLPSGSNTTAVEAPPVVPSQPPPAAATPPVEQATAAETPLLNASQPSATAAAAGEPATVASAGATPQPPLVDNSTAAEVPDTATANTTQPTAESAPPLPAADLPANQMLVSQPVNPAASPLPVL